MPTFHEFFAGGGMARAGLGPHWTCLFANDVDKKKGAAYRANWGERELRIADVRTLQARDAPGRADLAWASFPCQDLSLAGLGAGLNGDRSGTFYSFWNVIEALIHAGRGPKIVALENVCGTLTSHGGADFEAICARFVAAGYRLGALVIDAALFVPQSRPRLFIIGVRGDLDIDLSLVATAPREPFHSRALRAALAGASTKIVERWLWWNLPVPPIRNVTFGDLIDDDPVGVAWRSDEATKRLIALMSPRHLAKVEQAKNLGRRRVGAVYRRTRYGAAGERIQRAEIRFDDLAGCLRTPAGGSSRQTLLIVEGRHVRSRLISAREIARLMGLDEIFALPPSYYDAYRLLGDGVVAPVVRHLALHLLEPLLRRPKASARRAA